MKDLIESMDPMHWLFILVYACATMVILLDMFYWRP